VLICEHASNDFDTPWGGLGLDDTARQSHIAWDIGALRLAQRLAAALAPETTGAVLIHAPLSRLIYDLNRAPDQPDAMPELSETYAVPGNQALTPDQRLNRTEALYLPFHSRVHAEIIRLLAQGIRPLLLTIHSFTPVYHGQPRAVEFGVIHDADDTLAKAIVAAAAQSGLDTRLNEPYSAKDGVTHTLKLHATPYNLAHAMLEIRNDLLTDPQTENAMTERLTTILSQAFQAQGVPSCLAS
jgi:predicted N-formylglutamate amidohydrolase